MEVIHLDQPTAATMNGLRSLIKTYKKVNIGGKYDTALEKYTDTYKFCMDGVLGRRTDLAA